MPDQKICSSGQRTAELREFERLAARCYNCPDRQTPSLRNECCEFNRLSTAFISKDFDGKPSPCAPATLGDEFVLAKPPVGAAVRDSAVKAKSSSPKIAPRRAPLKTIRPTLSLKVAARAVKSPESLTPERKGEAWLSPKKPQSPHSKAATKLDKVKNSLTPESPQPYRGVRQRPGVKGYLVEIRPRRWKTTIWLGTYTTLFEAALAYDAGIFYTGKNIPFNFEESEGSFPPLPEHLSLADFRAENMDKVKTFVKEQALKAARRAKLLSKGVQQQLCKQEIDSHHSSSDEVQGRCVLSAVSASEKELGSLHVKKEDCDADWDQVITPNPFQNLGPLPVQVLVNDKYCCGGGNCAVQGCLPKEEILAGDEDLKTTKQTSCFTDKLFFDPSHDEESMDADNGLHLLCCSTNDGNLGTLGPYSMGCQSFDQSVQDLFAIDGISCFNFKACDSNAYPQVKSFCDFTFAIMQPDDPMGLPLSVEDLSFQPSWKYLSDEDPDDDEFPILLWSYAYSKG
jgi:hypothetical protein